MRPCQRLYPTPSWKHWITWVCLTAAPHGTWAVNLPGWGYPTDSLNADFSTWQKSPFVVSDTLGNSLEGRPIRHLEIADPASTAQRVIIHARTHPLEFQSTLILREMIRILLDSSAQSRELRRAAHWDMIPHANPDGVERMEDCAAGFGRCNAAGVDLERDWLDSSKAQPETRALRKFFDLRRSQSLPVQIALNMHSAFGCQRYFWTHDPAGTSDLYWKLQRNFVELVRQDWSSGILPYNAKTSWTSGNPGTFPESYWWQNRRESTMALTYEVRKECTVGPEDYAQSAWALLRGSVAYMRGDSATTPVTNLLSQPEFGPRHIQWPNSWQGLTWTLRDITGKILYSGLMQSQLSTDNLPLAPGYYVWTVSSPSGVWSHPWKFSP